MQVQLQVEDKALADAIWGAKQVVVCGVPRFKAPDFTRWRSGGRPPFAHIVLPIRDWSQAFAVDGGSLEAPPKAADKWPSHAAPWGTAVDVPVLGSGVPAKGVLPPEAQPSPGVLPVDHAPSGGTAPEHLNLEPEEDKLAAGGVGKAGDVASPDVGEKAPPFRQADPEPDHVPLGSRPIESEALSEAEIPGDAEDLSRWWLEAEKVVACPDDGAAPTQTPTIAAETAQLMAMGNTAPAASAGQVAKQEDAQPSPHEATAINVFPPMSVASDARARRSRGPMAETAEAVKQRTTKIMERSRSAARRFLAWFGGKG